MEQAKGYKTKQRSRILEFLIENKERHVRVEEVTDWLREHGGSVGKSTVYRYLDKLVEQGEVRRYHLAEGMGACYQYGGGQEACHCHYHMKCTGCGRLFHVECEQLGGLTAHIEKDHDFVIDLSKTVFYGLCSSCQEKHQTEE